MKQITIKEISALAGVSAGTVDRVLHGRGKVSAENRAKVEAVLEQVNYKFNLHSSAISFKRKVRITACIPTSGPGDYWSRIHDGFEKALKEFADIYIDFQYVTFSQFDRDSCHRMFEALLQTQSDGVIIGPIFDQETLALCHKLDSVGIPYVFVDGNIEGTNPIAFFSVNQQTAGKLAARIIHSICPEDSDFVVFRASGSQTEVSHNHSERSRGFIDYFKGKNMEDRVLFEPLSLDGSSGTTAAIGTFFLSHPSVKGAVTLNQRGCMVANALKSAGVKNVHLVSFDITQKNIECIEDGSIDVLIDQKPGWQGFKAVQALLSYLIYRSHNLEPEERVIPLEVVFKENLNEL